MSTIDTDCKDGTPKKSKGLLTAHSRKNTKSTLLTIKKNGHRDMQLLVDQTDQSVRRIYDGNSTWNVSYDTYGIVFTLNCRRGDILWLDDNEVRPSTARGFRLDWLQGLQPINVVLDKKRGQIPIDAAF
jgi:hypothetical protein